MNTVNDIQDYKHYQKASEKTNCLFKLIDALQNLNIFENIEDLRQYDIILDYNDNAEGFTTFIIKINSKKSNVNNTMFNINFKLKDKNVGKEIFENIRNYFLHKNDLQYSCFGEIDDYTSKTSKHGYKVITNHGVNLCSVIKDEEDKETLMKFDNLIREKYNEFNNNNNMTGLTKDQIQTLKSNEKNNIIYAIMNLLITLNDINENKDMYYIDFENKKKKDENFTTFSAKINKNDKSEIFNINFKLESELLGYYLFNKTITTFVVNNQDKFQYLGIDRNNDKQIISMDGIKTSLNLPEKYTNELYDYFDRTSNNDVKIKSKIKK